MDKILNEEMKAQAINIAMAIETGTCDFDYILDILKSDPQGATPLILFWSRFNDMTRNALERLCDYKARKILETCYEIS